MQFMIFAVILISSIAFVIYKINNKFETKEFIIFSGIIIVSILSIIIFLQKTDEKVPKLFILK